MKAFYFAANDKKLRYGDNREIKVGETHTVDCEPECCKQGLHASERLIDAVKYAPGHMLYLVELGGDIDKSDDKLAAQSRKYIAEFDAEILLREFARKQALINIDKIKPYCSDKNYNLIVAWLETGRDELKTAAYSAAYSAARSAVRSAAYSAADKMLTEMVKEKTGWDI